MFRLNKDGFDLEANGHVIEVRFGPMSASDNNTVSRKAFDAQPTSLDAEVKVFEQGNTTPVVHRGNVTVSSLGAIVIAYAGLSD